jgi:hypothetical protein
MLIEQAGLKSLPLRHQFSRMTCVRLFIVFSCAPTSVDSTSDVSRCAITSLAIAAVGIGQDTAHLLV